MSFALDLTHEERIELDTLLDALGTRSAPTRSLNELFGRWDEFVRTVERGYDDSIYEYTNDLSVRDRLQSLLVESSPTLRAKLDRALAPVDERFAAATVPAARPLSVNSRDLPSWWWRIPKRRGGELAEDLEVMGHVE